MESPSRRSHHRNRNALGPSGPGKKLVVFVLLCYAQIVTTGVSSIIHINADSDFFNVTVSTDPISGFTGFSDCLLRAEKNPAAIKKNNHIHRVR